MREKNNVSDDIQLRLLGADGGVGLGGGKPVITQEE